MQKGKEGGKQPSSLPQDFVRTYYIKYALKIVYNKMEHSKIMGVNCSRTERNNYPFPLFLRRL
jgi:hypothetical protein